MNKKTSTSGGMTLWDIVNNNLKVFYVVLIIFIALVVFIGFRCEINKNGQIINCKKCPEQDTIVLNMNNSNNFIEIDPSDSTMWNVDPESDFRFYNAPMGLAVEKHGPMNIRNLGLQVKYRFLVFETNDPIKKEESLNRIRRVKIFLEYLKTNNDHIHNIQAPLNNIQIGVQKNFGMPFLSFFIFESDHELTSIIYPGPVIDIEGKTYGAFRTNNKGVAANFKSEFNNKWKAADKFSVEEFIEYAKSLE